MHTRYLARRSFATATSKKHRRRRTIASAELPPCNLAAQIESLERRTMFAVTSTTPIPIAPTETQSFTGAVMNFTANDAGPFSATIKWGDAVLTAGVIAPSGGGFQVSGTHTYAEDGSYPVEVDITDTADATSVAPTTTATVGEQSASITAQATNFIEGKSATVLVATASDPGSPDPGSDFTGSIDWGDGSPVDTGTVTASGGGNFNITGTHTYANEGNYTVTTTYFENNEPGFSVSASNTATVAENPGDPSVLITGPSLATEGGMIVYNVSVTNNGGAPIDNVIVTDVLPAEESFAFAGFSQGGPFSAVGQTVSGNLGTIPGGATVSGSIVVQAVEEGYLKNSVSAASDQSTPNDIDDDGSAPVFTTVVDAPLTPTGGKTFSTTEGKTFSNVLLGSFSDGDPNGHLSDYTSALINWGDGHTSLGAVVADGAGFDVLGSHAYSHDGTKNITVKVKDAGGSTCTINATAKVAEASLTGFGRTFSAAKNVLASRVVGSFADANTLNTSPSDYTGIINWGDGTATSVASFIFNTTTHRWDVKGTHKYTKAGFFTVKIVVTDTKSITITSHANVT